MRVRVALFRKVIFGGKVHFSGDVLDIPEANVGALMKMGLVEPAAPTSDAEWIALVGPANSPETVPEPSAPDDDVSPNAHPECDPGPKPKGHRHGFQICPVDGCFCPTWKGKCKAHARANSKGQRYRDSHAGALAQRWKVKRRAYLNDHAYCENDAAHPALTAPHAAEVDHIDALGPAGPRGFDDSNLQALCKACHSRKTAGESFGR